MRFSFIGWLQVRLKSVKKFLNNVFLLYCMMRAIKFEWPWYCLILFSNIEISNEHYSFFCRIFNPKNGTSNTVWSWLPKCKYMYESISGVRNAILVHESRQVRTYLSYLKWCNIKENWNYKMKMYKRIANKFNLLQLCSKWRFEFSTIYLYTLYRHNIFFSNLKEIWK